MKSTLVLIVVFIISFSKSEFPQGEASLPFLLIQPSPSLSAMGQTGTAVPTDDPFGFVWNPAQLGYSSQTNNLSFIFYPSKIDWLGKLISGITLNGLALNAGYNFKNLTGVPLSLGFGYANTVLDYGTFQETDEYGNIIGTFTSKDYYNAYSIGIGVDYYIQFSTGFTIKNVNSSLGPFSVNPTVNDFGLLLNVPVLRLINHNLKWEPGSGSILKPDFNFSLGYSKSNIGDKVAYLDLSQADPLPRMDRIGYGITMGLNYDSNILNVDLINFSFTAEADDILISRDRSYQSTLSDLKFWKNLVDIQGDNNIVAHAGLKIDLGETFTYNTGHFAGRGFDMRRTNGYEIRAAALLKLYAAVADNPVIYFIRDHFDIRYYNTIYFAGNMFETKYTGLTFYIHNLNDLF